MSIKYKIAFLLIITLLVSFSLFYFQTVSRVRTENSRTTTEQTNILIDSKSKEIGLWLRNIINEFRLLSQMPAFKSMDMRAMTPYISNVTKMKNTSIGELSDLFAYGSFDGKSWVNGEQTFELITREEFLKIKNSSLEYIISEPKHVAYLNSDLFMIYYPIENYKEKKESLFIGGIKVDRLTELLKQIDVYGGKSWVMNPNGQVYTLNPIEFSYIMSASEKNDFLSKINPIQSAAVHYPTSTVFYSPIPYSQHWILCTQIDHNTMFKNTNLIIKNMQFLVFVMSISGVIIALLLSKTIVKPINYLQSKMLNVQLGNLESYYDGKHKDEIYYLGQTYNLMLDTINQLVQQISTTEEQKRQAYLAALQAQINPHFLYNTLASLKWLAQQQGANDVAHYIEHLSTFFRISLSEGAELIPFKQELNHIKSYLAIQQFRYKDRVSYSFEVDPELYDTMVPKLLLQPLVENAIVHGLTHSKRLGKILITAKKTKDHLSITVEDDGAGICDKDLKTLLHHLDEGVAQDNFGLYNIKQRLLLNYGENSSFSIFSQLNQGTSIHLTIPLSPTLKGDSNV